MAHDVFISYSTKDKPIADAVCATLESNGIRCWIAPRDIQPGADWSEAIVTAIDGAKLFILIFSSHANESPQVKRELQHGFEAGVLVIPFRVEDILPNKSLDYYLGSVHWLDALTSPLEGHLQNLAAKTKSLLQSGPGKEEEMPPRPLPPPPGPVPPIPSPVNPKSSAGLLAIIAAIVVVGAIVVFAVLRTTNRQGATVLPPAPPPAPVPVVNPAPAPTPVPTPVIQQPLPTTQVGGFTTPPPSSSAPLVDPVMADTWRMKFPTPNGDVTLTWIIHPDGTYASNVTGPSNTPGETGHVIFAKNNWQLRSDAGRTDQGTYTLQDSNDALITGTVGTAIWTRLSAALSTAQTVDPAIIGSWQMNIPTAQGNSLCIWTIDPDGRYGLTVTTNGNTQNEAGHLDFANSLWSLKADGGRADHGSYTVLNSNAISMTGNLGTGTWTRYSAANGNGG
jgi:hypothetical protein